MSIIEEIKRERACQDKKWGIQDHDLHFWCHIVGEEVGEAVKEMVEYQGAGLKLTEGTAIRARATFLRRLRAELIQSAATSVSMAQSVARQRMPKDKVRTDLGHCLDAVEGVASQNPPPEGTGFEHLGCLMLAVLGDVSMGVLDCEPGGRSSPEGIHVNLLFLAAVCFIFITRIDAKEFGEVAK